MFRTLVIGSLLLMTTTVLAQENGYRCYAGKLSNAAVKDISEVRIALAKGSKKASFIVFYSGQAKYSIDIFCSARIGSCSLENDGGSFKIVTLAGNQMLIQFNGKPLIARRENELLPAIASNGGLKSSIRMRLVAHPEKDCSY